MAREHWVIKSNDTFQETFFIIAKEKVTLSALEEPDEYEGSIPETMLPSMYRKHVLPTY